MDLRKYQVTPAQIEKLRCLIGYQPFILSDDVYVGVADIWSNGGIKKNVDRAHDDPELFERFCKAINQMRRMYDDWISFINKRLGRLQGLSVTDIACNAGHFLYRFREEGAAKATGYDINPKLIECFDILNTITGFDVSFNNAGYNMMTHSIPDIERSDIVIATGIMCHISDPIYFINFLGSCTNKALLLFSNFEDTEELRITFKEPRKFYDRPFPVCFDNMTMVSKPLALFSLKESGFNEIIEIPYNDSWMPYKWYKNFTCFLALK